MRRSANTWGGAYPGTRPNASFLQVGGDVVELQTHLGDLLAEGLPLDEWLRRVSAPPMSARKPLLSYGSNACPSKLVDLRDRGLEGPVVMTKCTVKGMAAAWCAGLRDGRCDVPATLVPAPGREAHFLWWVAPDQWPTIDMCEGANSNPPWYERVALRAPVYDHAGSALDGVIVYVGVRKERWARTDNDGHAILVRDLPQAEVKHAEVLGVERPTWIAEKRAAHA